MARRPVGYTIIGVLVALASAGAGATLLWGPDTSAFGVELPVASIILTVAQLVVGAVVAWAIWRYVTWAPEAYAGWALLGVASGVYSALVVMPRIMEAMRRALDLPVDLPDVPIGYVIAQLAIYAGIYALGYWYLARRRPPTAASQPTSE